MKLSEAIRLGSMLGPQARGTFQRSRKRWLGLFGPVQTEYCAMGAAIAAGAAKTVTTTYKAGDILAGSRRETTVADCDITCEAYQFPDAIYDVLRTVVPCPSCKRDELEIQRLIPHLNDEHRWTREKIADFVAQHEPKDEPTTTVECENSKVCAG